MSATAHGTAVLDDASMTVVTLPPSARISIEAARLDMTMINEVRCAVCGRSGRTRTTLERDDADSYFRARGWRIMAAAGNGVAAARLTVCRGCAGRLPKQWTEV